MTNLPAAPVRTLLASCLLALSASGWVAAEPAPWYWWLSQVDSARVCSQTPLGPGWTRIPRPYKDSRCEKLAIAK